MRIRMPNVGPEALETFAAVLVMVFVVIAAGGSAGLLVSFAIC
jgi:hypothetical protein